MNLKTALMLAATLQLIGFLIIGFFFNWWAAVGMFLMLFGYGIQCSVNVRELIAKFLDS